MHTIFSKFQSLLFRLIPKHNKTIYKLCRRYIDQFDGVNNSDMNTNGEQRVLQSVLPRCNLIFDVGANVGDWTLTALTINPQLTIHAFEPHLPTFNILTSQSFPDQVKLKPYGFSSTEEERVLYVQEDHTGMNSVYQRDSLPNHQSQGAITQTHIQLKTIDMYCQTNHIETIDYLKIDVEGHDLAVLLGAQEMLRKRQIRVIQFEYGGTSLDAGVLLKDFFTLLQAHDFVLYKIHPFHLQEVLQYTHSLETFQYQNWLAIQSELSANLIKTYDRTQK